MRCAFIVPVLLCAVVACRTSPPSAGDVDAAPTEIDAGPTDAGNSPDGWTCEAAAYDDGLVCHCECGAPDPDCDDADLLVSGCLGDQICAGAACTWCGNGTVEDDQQEECDPAVGGVGQCGPQGYEPGEVPCNDACRWAYDQCTPLETCGNGQLDPDELCDGELVQPRLTCADYDLEQGTLACQPGCAIDPSACHTCGNGVTDGPETCDDTGRAPEDGCSATCAVEPGWDCTGAPTTCVPRCGDGVIVGDERCDDGGVAGEDGCTSTCQIEADCRCEGEPSECSCLRVEVIATLPESQAVDAASITIDPSGTAHVAYVYGDDFTGPTGTNMEHAHVIHAARAGGGWTSSAIQTFDQIRNASGPESVVIAHDHDALRVFFERTYHPDGTFAVATRTGGAWELAYGDFYYSWHVTRGGGAWHALTRSDSWSGLQYVAGAPGAWTIEEPLPDELLATNLAHGATGDTYVSSLQADGTDSYTIGLHRRLGAESWAPQYTSTITAPAASQVHHLWSEPLPLPDGAVVLFDRGFDCTGAQWLRAHGIAADGAPELVVDLSTYYSQCFSSGSWSYDPIVILTAVDHLGQPHALFPAAPLNNSAGIRDHYRDATGWKTRMLRLPHAWPIAFHVDAAATHLVVRLPGVAPGTSRVAYVRVDHDAWGR